MSADSKTLTPALAIHPGEHLQDELEARGISQQEFAKQIGYQKTQLNEIIKGKRGINADLALILEAALGIGADYWLNLQKNYELNLAKISAKNQNRLEALSLWTIIQQVTPVKFFKKQGVLSGDPVEDIPVIKGIYGISNLEQMAAVVANGRFAHFRRSEKQVSEKRSIIGWYKLCEFKANQINVAEFNQSVRTSLITDLNRIFYDNENTVIRVKSALNEAGIKLVIQERGESMPIDGVSFWSNGRPAIGITLRYKRLDWLAFTLFHELGHVFCHLVNNSDAVIIDLESTDLEYKKTKEEIEADEFARNSMIAPDLWKAFIAGRKIADKQILEFSEVVKIHPSVILGRRCFETGNYMVRTKIDRKIY